MSNISSAYSFSSGYEVELAATELNVFKISTSLMMRTVTLITQTSASAVMTGNFND